MYIEEFKKSYIWILIKKYIYEVLNICKMKNTIIEYCKKCGIIILMCGILKQKCNIQYAEHSKGGEKWKKNFLWVMTK